MSIFKKKEKYKIDPALEARLKKRGMTDKVTELKGAYKEAKKAVTPYQPISKERQDAAAEAQEEVRITGPGKFTKSLQNAENTSEKVDILSDVVPGGKLAQGIGYALSPSYTRKINKEGIKRGSQLESVLNQKIELAKTPEEKKKWLIEKSYLLDTPISSEMALEDAPSNKQIIMSSAELALLTATGYKGGLKGTSGKYLSPKQTRFLTSSRKKLKAIEKAKKYSKLSKTGKVLDKTKDVIKATGKEAAIGAVFFGLNEGAVKENATLSDIIRSAGTGGVFSSVVSLASHGFGGALKVANKYIKPEFQRKADDMVVKLKRIANTNYKVKSSEDPRAKMLGLLSSKRNVKQKLAQAGVDILESPKKFQTKIMDKYHPFKKVEKDIYNVVGHNIDDTSEKVYRDARLWESVASSNADDRITGLLDDLGKYKDIRKDYTAALVNLDDISRLKSGKKTASGLSYEQSIINYKKLSSQLGPEKMARVEEIRNLIQNYNKKLLNDRVKVGLISRDLAESLLEQYPDYIPHNVMMDAEEIAYKGMTDSLNVSKTDIMKAIGSTRKIDNPIEAMVQRTKVAEKIMEKNRLLNNVIKAQEKYNVFGDSSRILKGNQKAKTGEQVISLFRNGHKEQWVVPQDIASVVKNLDSTVTPKWFKAATYPVKILKNFATKYNLSFSVPNLFRDRQTAAITAGSFIEDMAKKTGVNPKSVNLSTRELDSLYKKSGGIGANIFREGDATILNKFEKSGITKVVDSANPLKIINTVNEQLEKSTRLKVFRQALERGLSNKDAALVARDATVDFGKMGTQMKWMNQVVPFLNARVQGFSNLGKAVKNNPEMFARMQMYTAVYPSMMLHAHNRKFESFKNISQHYKNKYWLIMTGEEDITDQNGNRMKAPQFVTVPKGEGQALVSGPIQYYLDRADGIDKRSVTEMLVDTVGGASPIAFQSFENSNFISTAISQFGPAGTLPVGLGTNVDPYFGNKVVPESTLDASKKFQSKKTTPTIIKDLTNTINSAISDDSTKGIAPAQLEYSINSFGGLAKDTTEVLNLLYGKLTDQDVTKESITGTPFGQASKQPFLRSFLREDKGLGTTEMSKKREQLKQVTAQEKDIDIMKKEYEEEIMNKLSKLDTQDEKKNLLKALSASGDIDMDTIKSISKKIKMRKTVDVINKYTDKDVRAAYIAKELEQMDSQEEKKEYLKELAESNLIDESTIQDVIIYGNASTYELYEQIKNLNANELKAKLKDLASKKLIDMDMLKKLKTIRRYEKLQDTGIGDGAVGTDEKISP